MTHIWVPKIKILETELAPTKLGVCGEYTIKKYKVGVKEPVQVVGPFKNLITNWGMDRIGPGTLNSSYIYLGTGTATPTVGDLQLANYAARTDLHAHTPEVIERDETATLFWTQTSLNKRFNPGKAVGTFTEIGFGDNGSVPPTPSPTYRLMSRALIVDGSGSPVAITVLADEYLDVTYTVRMYPPLADSTQTVTISGVSYTFNSRGLNFPNSVSVVASAVDNRLGFAGQRSPEGSPVVYSGTAAGTPPALAPITASSMLNSGAQNGSGTYSAKSSSGHTVTVPFSFGLGAGNLPYGIRGLATPASSQFLNFQTQATITPAIPKNNTKVFSMGFSYSYVRY